MGDAEHTLPPTKKRAAGREISRDNPGLDDDEETSEQEIGTFKKASEEVLAARRIVKVRRAPPSSTQSANPFAGIQLISSAVPKSVAPEATDKVVSEKKAPEIVDGNSNAKEETDESKGDVDEPTESKADVEVKTDVKEEDTANQSIESEVVGDDKSIEVEKTEVEDKKVVGEESAEDKDKKDSSNESVDGNSNAKEETDESKGDVAGPIESKADDEAKTDVKEEDTANQAIESEVVGGKSTEVEKTEVEDKKVVGEESAEDMGKKDSSNESVDKSGGAASFSSFQQLSSTQNAFTGIVGTGFCSSSFSFGVSKDGSSASCGSGFSFGQKTDQHSFAFNFSNNNNGSSLFGTQGVSTGNKIEKVGFPSMQEVPVETGEENEKAVFSADSVLFEFHEGGWKERGKGEIKVNVPTTGTGKARLVMRTKGNYRLILNASLYPDMKLTNMDKKGITFACINSGGEGKEGLSTFALKFKDVSLVEEFSAVVTEHKNKASVVLRTPENSPKASDE